MLIGRPTRAALTDGDKAEFKVWDYLNRELPEHWLILCGVPEKSGRDKDRKRQRVSQIDCIVIADRLLFVVGIKSHGGCLRVYRDQPWQKNGTIIGHKANAEEGFWANHDRQCYSLKKLLDLRGIRSDQVIPKVIVEAKDLTLEFGASDLAKDVLAKEEFYKQALHKDRNTSKPRILKEQKLAVLAWLKDVDLPADQLLDPPLITKNSKIPEGRRPLPLSHEDHTSAKAGKFDPACLSRGADERLDLGFDFGPIDFVVDSQGNCWRIGLTTPKLIFEEITEFKRSLNVRKHQFRR